MRRGCLRFISLLLGVTQYESPLGTGAVLPAARGARALHTTSLSDYLLLFSVLTNILKFLEMRNHTSPLPPPSPKKNKKHLEPKCGNLEGWPRVGFFWEGVLRYGSKPLKNVFSCKTTTSRVAEVRFY